VLLSSLSLRQLSCIPSNCEVPSAPGRQTTKEMPRWATVLHLSRMPPHFLDRPHHSEDPERLSVESIANAIALRRLPRPLLQLQELTMPDEIPITRYLSCRIRPVCIGLAISIPRCKLAAESECKDPTKRQGPSNTLQDLPARFSGVKQTYFSVTRARL
jgi:hypothetical protein